MEDTCPPREVAPAVAVGGVGTAGGLTLPSLFYIRLTRPLSASDHNSVVCIGLLFTIVEKQAGVETVAFSIHPILCLLPVVAQDVVSAQS